MDQRTGRSQRNAEDAQSGRKEGMGEVEERGEEMNGGNQATVHRAKEGFKEKQEAVDGAKTAVDEMLERGKGTVHETVERVKPMADLVVYVQQNPWLLVGSAILTGNILGRLTRERSSAH